jgi:hypothetical protein
MLILTDDEVLARGLELAGFDEAKQAKAGEISNVLLFTDHQ